MPNPLNIVTIDSANPESELIIKAGKIITSNGIVIFPAQCLYGVAANALNEDAVQKVFQLKQRPYNNPILVLIPNRSHLNSLVSNIPEIAEKLMDRFWPGNLTILFDAKNMIPTLLTANTNKIGIRIPSHPVAKAFVNHLDMPITGTSANLSGQPGCSQIGQLPDPIVENADLILESGPLRGGTGSTIVDVTHPDIKILREGIITSNMIDNFISDKPRTR